jgi:hypothetical protein
MQPHLGATSPKITLFRTCLDAMKEAANTAPQIEVMSAPLVGVHDKTTRFVLYFGFTLQFMKSFGKVIVKAPDGMFNMTKRDQH